MALFIATFSATMFIAAKPAAAAAAEMDKNAKADAKTAMRFYKEGNYEDAAKVFLKLSIAYPDMSVFVRNLGACYYYMRRYEPALSNLRDYEHRKKDMTPDDRAEVEGWIGEMERLRDQATAVAPPPAVPLAELVAPVAAAAAPVPPPPAVVPLPSPESPTVAPPAQASPNGYPQQQSMGGQPAYPQAQNSAQPSYPYPQYSPAGGGYPPTYQPVQPSSYPTSGPPVGVTAPPSQPKSSGSARKAVAWILGIAGVGSAGLGGYFAYKAVDNFSKVEKKYDPSLESEGKTDRKAAWILGGAGAAALTIAIIVGASGDSSSSAVALAPIVGSGAAGASLSGRF
jgi:tetratricopeptide (TPR) repeat protein